MKNTNFLLSTVAVISISLALGGCQLNSSENTLGGFGTVEDSADLSLKVRSALKQSPQTAISNISVSLVGQDTVKLSGFVSDDATSHAAERVAGQVEGVRHVFNSLTVRR